MTDDKIIDEIGVSLQKCIAASKHGARKYITRQLQLDILGRLEVIKRTNIHLYCRIVYKYYAEIGNYEFARRLPLIHPTFAKMFDKIKVASRLRFKPAIEIADASYYNIRPPTSIYDWLDHTKLLYKTQNVTFGFCIASLLYFIDNGYSEIAGKTIEAMSNWLADQNPQNRLAVAELEFEINRRIDGDPSLILNALRSTIMTILFTTADTPAAEAANRACFAYVSKSAELKKRYDHYRVSPFHIRLYNILAKIILEYPMEQILEDLTKVEED